MRESTNLVDLITLIVGGDATVLKCIPGVKAPVYSYVLHFDTL